MSDNLTLSQAKQQNRIERFIAEHEADKPGDAGRFNATLTAMARKSKAVPVASSEVGSDD
jgi:hypothetical protein